MVVVDLATDLGSQEDAHVAGLIDLGELMPEVAVEGLEVVGEGDGRVAAVVVGNECSRLGGLAAARAGDFTEAIEEVGDDPDLVAD